MKLFGKFLDKAISEEESKEIEIKFIGDLNVFNKQIKDKANFLSNLINKKKKLTLTIAVNYGGQQEILIAVKKYLEDFLKNKKIKFPVLGKPIRFLLINSYQGPSISDIFVILGKKDTIDRLNQYRDN
jgi:undecaprenyl diphosphate synthase